MSGVPQNEIVEKDFIMVRPALVKRLGGANEAVVWARLHFRCDESSRVAYERDGEHWWAATTSAIAEDTGLTVKQVRGAIDSLVEGGFLAREQHALGGNYDQTYSYRTVVEPGQMHVPSGANGSALEGNCHLPSGANVPSKKEEKKISSSEPASGPDGEWIPSDEVVALCEELATLVRANGHKVGTVGKLWWVAADRLLRVDKLTVGEVRAVAQWATRDEFWSANIRSMPKLREKFSTLRARMARSGPPSTAVLDDARAFLDSFDTENGAE